MSFIFSLSLVTAVLCGIWSWFAGAAGLIAWVGFAGCTTYFACGSHGKTGLRRTIIPNITGVACGMAIILLSSVVPALGTSGVWCAIITFVMCYISKYKWFDFCPGIFMGCFVTFAAGGDWKGAVISFLCGAVLGLGCDFGSAWLYKKFKKK